MDGALRAPLFFPLNYQQIVILKELVEK